MGDCWPMPTRSVSTVFVTSRSSTDVSVSSPSSDRSPPVSVSTFREILTTPVKIGRICQLAFLGQITTRFGIHLPGDIDYSGHSFESYPNGLAGVFGPDAIPQGGLIQLIAFVGFLELFVMKDVTGESEFPGDFRNGALDFGWDTFDEETKLSKRGIELNNGRAAM